MRPGETEYLGAKAEHNLDTAIIEVPLGKVGMNYSVILDGSTFFWILTEIQKKHPQIKLIKDMAAAAVLIASLAAVVVGCLIFIPKLF